MTALKPLIRRFIAEDRLVCRECSGTIEVGQEGECLIYDGNPLGTGPSRCMACSQGESR